MKSYRLTDAGFIETTYTFRDGGFDGPEKRFTPKGWVHDHETNAEWRMQFVWPFAAAYLIVYLDESGFPRVAHLFTGFAPRQFLRLDPRDSFAARRAISVFWNVENSPARRANGAGSETLASPEAGIGATSLRFPRRLGISVQRRIGVQPRPTPTRLGSKRF